MSRISDVPPLNTVRVQLIGGPADGEWVNLDPQFNIAHFSHKGGDYGYVWGGLRGRGMACLFKGPTPKAGPLVIDRRLFNWEAKHER